MRSWYSSEIAKGAMLGVIAFVLVSSSIPVPTVKAATAPYFTITLIAPTSNPQRRQWAAIIQNSLASANIDAHLTYVSFTFDLGVLFGCSNGCPAKDFAHGGWDAAFVGNSPTTTLPDFGTQSVVGYRNEGPGDIPPVGGNEYFWKNTTYNALADDYNTNFNVAQRLVDAQKMVSIAVAERPGIIIYYPQTIWAWSSGFKSWGTDNAVSQITGGIDFQHWSTGSVTSINVGLTGTLDAVNPLPTSSQNSFYDRYLAGFPYGAEWAVTQEADARGIGVYYNALATSITSSPDHLTWTESFKAHTFQDGVAVTADDYVFDQMSASRVDVGSTSVGANQALLGIQNEFHFLNGTVDYVNNGTYFHGVANKPATWAPNSVWTALNSTTFKFTMPSAYPLTNPLLTGIPAMPMHIYEKVPAATWASSFLAGYTGSSGGLSNNHVTVTWSTARYGGNGSYAWVYGPVGDGPYTYRGYDPVSQTGTLTKWPGYWNATGLQSLGEFTATTIHVQTILAKDAAIAAFGNKQVNFLDAQYTFNPQDANVLKGLGATIAAPADPSNGWQEMPLNNNAPIWGTGVGTPLGQSNPAKAAFAARMVREAFSYLVPRQLIINSLTGGLGLPGITQFNPGFGVFTAGDIYKPGTKADPYDPVAAASFLAAAGYATGVPPPTPGQTIVLPTTTINIPGSNIAVPNFFVGNSFTLSGIYQPVNTASQLKFGGFAIVLEQSVDQATTWQPVSGTYTNVGGYYTMTFTPTVNGTVWYRLFFSGVPVSYVNSIAYGSPASIEAVTPPTAPKAFWQNVTATSYGPVSKLNIGSFAQVIGLLASGAQVQTLGTQLQNALNTLTSATQASLNTLQTAQSTTNAQVATVQASVNTLNTNVSNLQSQVSTLQNIAYAALAVAVVLGLLAIGLGMRKRS
jgi:hypothetical protein